MYEDYETSFSDLLAKDSSFTVHQTDFQTLFLEMYKKNITYLKLFEGFI